MYRTLEQKLEEARVAFEPNTDALWEAERELIEEARRRAEDDAYLSRQEDS